MRVVGDAGRNNRRPQAQYRRQQWPRAGALACHCRRLHCPGAPPVVVNSGGEHPQSRRPCTHVLVSWAQPRTALPCATLAALLTVHEAHNSCRPLTGSSWRHSWSATSLLQSDCLACSLCSGPPTSAHVAQTLLDSCRGGRLPSAPGGRLRTRTQRTHSACTLSVHIRSAGVQGAAHGGAAGAPQARGGPAQEGGAPPAAAPHPQDAEVPGHEGRDPGGPPGHREGHPPVRAPLDTCRAVSQHVRDSANSRVSKLVSQQEHVSQRECAR